MSSNSTDEYADILETIKLELSEQSTQIDRVENGMKCLENDLEGIIGNRNIDLKLLKFAEETIFNISSVINGCIPKLQGISNTIDDSLEIINPNFSGNTNDSEVVVPFIPKQKQLESFNNFVKVFLKNEQGTTKAKIIGENPKTVVNPENHEECIFNCYFSLSTLVSELLELKERLQTAHTRLQDEMKRVDFHYLHPIKEREEETADDEVAVEHSEDCNLGHENKMDEATKLLDAELESLKKQLEESKQAVKLLSSEKSYYEKRMQDSKKEKSSFETESTNLRKELVETIKKIKRSEYEYSILQENFEKSEDERGKLQLELTSLQILVDEIRTTTLSVENEQAEADNSGSNKNTVQENGDVVYEQEKLDENVVRENSEKVVFKQEKSGSFTVFSVVAALVILAISILFYTKFSRLFTSS